MINKARNMSGEVIVSVNVILNKARQGKAKQGKAVNSCNNKI